MNTLTKQIEGRLPPPPVVTTTVAPTRVLIVDGQPLLRSGLAAFLNAQPDLTVCAEAGEPRAALAAIRATRPDLVISDVALPGKGGIELIKDIRSLHPELPVLVFSLHPQVQYVERVLLAGARGYVLKTDEGPTLLGAIRQVLRGKLYVNAEMSAHLIEHYTGAAGGSTPGRRGGSGGDSPLARLSDRELQILDLIGAARSSREIAAELIISIKTVESHRANIKQKLGVRSAQELMRLAVCWVETRGVSSPFSPRLTPSAENDPVLPGHASLPIVGADHRTVNGRPPSELDAGTVVPALRLGDPGNHLLGLTPCGAATRVPPGR